MDDWDKFQGNNSYQTNAESAEGNKDQNSQQSSEFGRTIYVDNSEAPHKASHEPRPKKESKYVTKKALIISLIVCMVFSAAIGAGAYALAMSTFGGSTVDKTVRTTNYNLTKATGSELSMQEIIARNENSVVAISTESVSTDSWLGQYVTKGAGSGVIYSEDGYILTNNHVISGASSIKITLHNGDVHDATLVATDSQTDIAVLKIDAKDLTPVTIGDMKKLCVGDLAVAIGNPLGTLSGTATEGIISALEREITLDGKSMSLIQTSASINPGNSGGGLFDQYGNLIGIVVAKSSGSDVEGLGFAIPVDKVDSVAKSLIENGYVEGRPAAGITVLDLTDVNTAMQYGVTLTGVYIQDVNGENAKKAGLKSGDLIYYIDDVKVTSSSVLLKEIQKHEVGDEVEFTIVRDNDMIKAKVVLEESSKFLDDQNQDSNKNIGQ